MKSATYTSSFLAVAALSARQALAQTPLSGETNQVCGFTLSTDGNAIVRTNDFNLARDNGDAALSPANFWITGPTSSRMYGSNGQRCDFDPYLECDSNDNDNDRDNTPFTISNSGILSFTGQSTFYLCAANAFTDFDDDGTIESTNEDNLQAYPYIYPPTGTTGNSPRNYENCTQATLVADRCFEASNEYTVAPSAAVASSTGLPSQTATGTGSVTGPTGTTSGMSTASGTGAAATASSATATAAANGAAGLAGGDGLMISGLVGVAALMFAL